MKARLSLSILMCCGMFCGPSAFSQEPLVDLAAELEEIKKKEQAHSAPDTHNNSAPSTDTPANSNMRAAPKSGGKVAGHASPVQAHEVHWGYSGEGAPRYWAQLAEEFSLCGEGKNQSPIDIRDERAIGTQGLAELDIRYRDVPMKALNNGHTLQINYPLGSYIRVGGKRYELLQFHFHTPSEHQKEGFNYPMEVHLVHSDGDKNLAVIGILFQEGQHNPALDILLERLPKEVGKQEVHSDIGLNPVNFFPGNTDFYKYSGSLTTPPCSEGVYWMVFKHPVEASIQQIQKMNEVMGENARPVSPQNSRDILKSWAEQVEDTRPYELY